MKMLNRPRLPNLAAAPSSPSLGELYCDTVTNLVFAWNGTRWRNMLNVSDYKESVEAATTGAETFTIAAGSVTQIAGTTVDGVALAIGDRVLVKDAPAATGVGSALSTQPGNGIYTVTNATTNLTLARSYDGNDTGDLSAGTQVLVEAGGTANANSQWSISIPTSGDVTVGTTAVRWASRRRFELGTAALPAISFLDDPNTGIYSPGADQLSVATAGANRITISASGLVVGGVTVITGAAGGIYDARTATQSLLRNFLLSSDTNPAFRIAGDGKEEWGLGGANAVDTNWYRNGVGELKTDGKISALLQFWAAQAAGANAGSPGFSFAGDPNTGMYSSAADTLDFATGGSNRLSINSAGLISLPGARVTSLPGSPVDGQEVYYVANASENTIWHLRYKTSITAWEFVGGSPLSTLTPVDSTAAGTALPLAAAPANVASVTVPLAGSYIVDYKATVRMHTGTTSAYAALYLNGVLNTSTRKASLVDAGPVDLNGLWHPTALAANDAVSLRLWCDVAAANAKYWGSGLVIWPVKLT